MAKNVEKKKPVFITSTSIQLLSVQQQIFVIRGKQVMVDRDLAALYEIIGIEPVVAQLIEHDLIGGEVRHLLGELPLQLFNSHQQHGFAELVLMHAVALVTDRADGEHPAFVLMRTDQWPPGGNDLLNSQPFARELALRQFVAVSYDLTVAVIDVRRAESDEHHICLRKIAVKPGQRLQTVAQHLFAVGAGERAVMRHRVEQPVVLNDLHAHVAVERLNDRHRVVQHAGRVTCGLQTAGLHLLPDAVGKTRADQQDSVRERQLPRATGDLYFSAPLHDGHLSIVLTPTSRSPRTPKGL